MTVQNIPPNLEDRVRVILEGPGEMRLIVECAICEEILTWQGESRCWWCENCEVKTTAREMSGLFQDCSAALAGEKPPPEVKKAPTLGEGLGKWRDILKTEMQRRLKGD